MRVILDDLWFCTDCVLVAVNDDATSLDFHYSRDESEKRLGAIRDGLIRLGPGLSPDFDAEKEEGIETFSRRRCDCCDTHLGGERHRFCVLGE